MHADVICVLWILEYVSLPVSGPGPNLEVVMLKLLQHEPAPSVCCCIAKRGRFTPEQIQL